MLRRVISHVAVQLGAQAQTWTSALLFATALAHYLGASGLGVLFLRLSFTSLVAVRKVAIVTQGRVDTSHGFVVLPRRWVVERTFAWLRCNPQLAKDYEELPECSKTRPGSIFPPFDSCPAG